MRPPIHLSLHTLLAAAALLTSAQLSAQTPAAPPAPTHGPTSARAAVSAPAQTSASAPATLPALFLSDIHLDPFVDPTKAAALNAAPAADWSRILAAPAGPALTGSQQSAFAACFDGPDTSYTLWQSTLSELRKTATSSRFVVISGDLLAHKFDCKYKALVPGATNASYLAFTVKTVRYVLTTLRAALPGVPIYTALGNNDSGCVDYALDSTHDGFLAAIAPIVAEMAAAAPSSFSQADRAAAEHDFATLGAFNLPLAALPHTRILSLDDLYFSAKYVTCSGKPDPAPATAAAAWLKTQLDAARAAHDRVWFVGHIPPGVDLYATARKLVNVCGGARPTMFLGSEVIADTLSANSDIVRLALFGHTHDDEFRLLTPEVPTSDERLVGDPLPPQSPGVPLKIVASVTPVHGNHPTFTLARVAPASATLVDYTVVMASNITGVGTSWAPEYTFSTTFHQPAFDAASLAALIGDFQGDPGDKWPASQTYIRQYFPTDAATATANAAVISAAWQPYACTLNHDSAKSFAACTCAK